MQEEDKETVGIYVGKTSRQLGTRVIEHMDNLKNFKRESFVIDHWMEAHGTDTIAPTFEFKVLGCHSDAFSRQLSEAIYIRLKGNLNRKNEFISNELIRLESSSYSWEQARGDKLKVKRDRDYEERLSSFIYVMKNVSNLSNKRKVSNMSTDIASCSRSSGPIQEEATQAPCKRTRMESSTPIAYRVRPEIVLTSSPIDHLGLDFEGMNLHRSSDQEESMWLTTGNHH